MYFSNTDISLIITPIHLKTPIHLAETHLEGSVSQDFDIGLSFCFIVCRRRELGKMTETCKSYLFFVIKSKPEPKQNIWDMPP